MRSLPNALTPWAEQLALLPTDLAFALVPWLSRIDAALGELGAGRTHDDGEPDGYDGVHARGPYQRLLPAHWLLADEQPEEFMRRAVMGEHRFFRIARRMPEAERVIVALLDAGPDQLGSPRIGQLAALIVLARRAARSNARLLWCSLRAPYLVLSEGLDASALKSWLAHRNVARPTDTDLGHWLAKLDTYRVSQDRWLIGARRLAALEGARGMHQLAFESPLFSETESLALSVRASGARTFGRTFTLPMPPPPIAVRLLRDPFEEARATPRTARRGERFDLASPPQLAADCRSVTVRLESGEIVSYPFASSPNATPGKPRYFRPPPRHRVLAVTRVGKRALAVTLRGNTVRLFGVGTERAETGHNMATISFASRVIAAVRMGDRLDDAQEEVPLVGPLGALIPQRVAGGLAFTVVRGDRVTELHPTDGVYGVIEHVGILATASGTLSQGAVFVRRLDDRAIEVRSVHDKEPWLVLRTTEPLAATDVFLGYETLAVRAADGAFWVQRPGHPAACLRAPKDFVVVGALDGGLLCTSDEGQRLQLIKRDRIATLAASSARIARVSVGFTKPVIAYTTDAGGLHVVEHGRVGPVLRVHAPEAS